MRVTHQIVRLTGLVAICAITARVPAQTEADSSLIATNDFTFMIHSSLPPFRFHLIRRTNQDWQVICAIEISRGSDSRPWQILTNETQEPRLGDTKPLTLEDANFDGYQDLMTINWAGATGNTGYLFWLFNTNRQRFEFNVQLSELCSPVFDAEDRKIRTHGRGGAAGMIFYDATYVWERGTLKMIEQIDQDYERRPLRDWWRDRTKLKWLKYEPDFVRLTRVWTNGVWKEKSERVRLNEE